MHEGRHHFGWRISLPSLDGEALRTLKEIGNVTGNGDFESLVIRTLMLVKYVEVS